MPSIAPPPGLTIDDYEQIESAVMETARGRWFLLEFARRVRANESQQLLDAIERLGQAVESNFNRFQNGLSPSLPSPHEVRALAQPETDPAAVPLPMSELGRPPDAVTPPSVSTASPLMARLEANLRQPLAPSAPPSGRTDAPEEIDVRAVFAPLDVMGERERLAFFA